MRKNQVNILNLNVRFCTLKYIPHDNVKQSYQQLCGCLQLAFRGKLLLSLSV